MKRFNPLLRTKQNEFSFSRCAAFLILCLLSTVAVSHTKLSNSSPAADAKLDQAPSELRLSYSTDVRIMALVLKNEDGVKTDLGFKPSAETADQFQFHLPALENGNYTVDWSILGEDGHKMTGGFSFTVQ